MLEACLLHRYDWSESSLIVELFTREQGRLAAVAKGAKRPHSQLRPVLLPFQRLHIALARSASEATEVQTLRSAEWAGGRPMLSGGSLFRGFYLNELLLKLLARHDPFPALFDAYLETLPALAEADDAQSQAALRAFELRLLRETGVLPELGVVTQTQRPLVEGGRYMLRPEGGLAEAAAFGGEGVVAAVWMALQAALDAGDLPALQRACRLALTPLRSQLRAALHYHLGSSTLRTRQVMLDVQKLQGREAAAAARGSVSPDTGPDTGPER